MLRTFLLVTTLFCCLNSCFATDSTAKVDLRLGQKVSYEAWHTPIKTILADLSEKTGVKLNSGYSNKDWQVRDRKMNVRVSDVTLRELMNSVARVMKFKWTINEDVDPPTYRLCVDRTLLAKLQAEANRRENEFKREQMKRRTALVEAFAEVANASGTELQALRETNPYLYMCAQTGFAKFMTAMFREDPFFRDTFIRGDKNLIPPMTVLSPQTVQLCANVMRKAWAYDNIGAENTRPLPDDLDDTLKDFCVHMRLMPRPYEWNFRIQLQDFGSIGTYCSAGDEPIGQLKDPNAKSTQTWAKSMLSAVEGSLSAKDMSERVWPEIEKAEVQDSKEIEYYFMYDPIETHADEPDLHNEIELKMSDETKKYKEAQLKLFGEQAVPRIEYQTNLRMISESAKMNIVTDSFAVVFGRFTSSKEKQEFQKVLDDLADGYTCNWQKYGSIIEISRRDWFRRRSSQVPDEWIEPWRDEIKETGTVSLDTYCKMTYLTDEQIEENFINDSLLDRFIGMWWQYSNNKGFARFYQQLTSDQKSMILTEEGMDVSLISPTQWPYYAAMFQYGSRHAWDSEPFTDLSQHRVTLYGFRDVNPDGSCVYHFRTKYTQEDGTLRKDGWDVPLPMVPHPQKQ